MKKHTISRCVIASLLSVTAISWAQTSGPRHELTRGFGHHGRVGDTPANRLLAHMPEDDSAALK